MRYALRMDPILPPDSEDGALAFPLAGKSPAVDADPDGFRRFDLALECPIPVPGKGHPGAFAHVRSRHIHEGIDLYGREGDMALALFGGEVVSVEPFTGPLAGSPWWLPTMAVAVEGPFGVAFHGEIDPLPGIRAGMRVEAGDPLGTLARVLRNDKGRPLHMLHLELYERGARASVGIWELGAPRPAGLLDPTELVLRAAFLPSPPKARRRP